MELLCSDGCIEWMFFPHCEPGSNPGHPHPKLINVRRNERLDGRSHLVNWPNHPRSLIKIGWIKHLRLTYVRCNVSNLRVGFRITCMLRSKVSLCEAQMGATLMCARRSSKGFAVRIRCDGLPWNGSAIPKRKGATLPAESSSTGKRNSVIISRQRVV